MINRQYKIIKKLGEGRSKVFLAMDLVKDEEIALKILPKDSPEDEKIFFRTEFLTLQKINHPHIIKAYDYGSAFEIDDPEYQEHEGCAFFTLENYNGVELPEHPGVNDEKILSIIIKQICEALFYLHQSGYIYYDLKPENILVSSIDEKIFIKLIDLGFARRRNDKDTSIRGTAEYIAPEILRREPHDHRVDLYALGIILYRLVYKNFPFNTSSQIEIYKAQVEEEFKFPQSPYSIKIAEIIKKLLRKDPAERYISTLQVITDLGFTISREMTSYFLPVKSFAARKDLKTILQRHISDKNSTEVFIIKGTEGAGKTSLFIELRDLIENSVLIENEGGESGLKFVIRLLKKLVYSEFLFPRLSNYETEKYIRIISGNSSDLITDLKSFFTSICRHSLFTILLDDFDHYDDFVLEMMNEIMPILQANNIKVIISENSEKKSAADFLFNRREIHLSSFMESELSEFLDLSYAAFFPKAELKKCILLYADLLPGNIEDFIRDLLLFDVLKYSGYDININVDNDTERLLKSSHEVIYQVRLNQLTELELSASELLACFKTSPEIKIIAALLEKDSREVRQLFEELGRKNILLNEGKNAPPVFSTTGMKEFIYSMLDDPKKLHLKIAALLEEKFPYFSNQELARQFELAGQYEKSYTYFRKEIDYASGRSLFSYQRNILQHLLNFPLNREWMNKIKTELAGIQYMLGDYRSSIGQIEELDEKIQEQYEVQLIKGGSLIGIGEPDKGVQILRKLQPETPEKKLPGLLLKIASAEFDLNNFKTAEEICSSIQANPQASVEETGKSLNLIGLIRIYTENAFDKALYYFSQAESIYREGKLLFGVAQMQNNIANIYNLQGDFEKAEKYWNESLKLNLEIGNLEQEANLALNFGVLYFERQDYEETLAYYKRALAIYTTLGNRLKENIVMVNLGEIYLVLSEYGEALRCLESAAKNLRLLKNSNEEAEALFLLSKLYLTIGDSENFEKVFEPYEALLSTDVIPEKNRVYIRYLRIIAGIRFGEKVQAVKELRTLRNYFLEQKEKHKFTECSFYIIYILLMDKRYKEAFIELTNDTLLEFSKLMNNVEVERNYYLSVAASENTNPDAEPAIDFLQRANELLQEASISEITWKVFYALALHYHDRGNFTKAEEFIIYCTTLIYFLAESIKDEKLRRKYLEYPERKHALEKLKILEEQY